MTELSGVILISFVAPVGALLHGGTSDCTLKNYARGTVISTESFFDDWPSTENIS